MLKLIILLVCATVSVYAPPPTYSQSSETSGDPSAVSGSTSRKDGSWSNSLFSSVGRVILPSYREQMMRKYVRLSNFQNYESDLSKINFKGKNKRTAKYAEFENWKKIESNVFDNLATAAKEYETGFNYYHAVSQTDPKPYLPGIWSLYALMLNEIKDEDYALEVIVFLETFQQEQLLESNQLKESLRIKLEQAIEQKEINREKMRYETAANPHRLQEAIQQMKGMKSRQ